MVTAAAATAIRTATWAHSSCRKGFSQPLSLVVATGFLTTATATTTTTATATASFGLYPNVSEGAVGVRVRFGLEKFAVPRRNGPMHPRAVPVNRR
jgi:hypothetical protein